MPTGTLMPYGVVQYFDDNGDPLAGGLLYTYAAGTTSPLATYSDSDLAVIHQNTNPIVLDASGRAVVFALPVSYMLDLKTSEGVSLSFWPIDNVAPPGSPSVVGGAGLIQDMGGDSTSPITDTAYPSGATFDKCHAGTALFIANSTNLPGTYVFKGMLMGNDGATVTLELVNLTDAPDTLITSISSNSTTGAFVTSGSIAWAAPGSNKTYGLKAKVDTGSGFAWALSLVRIA